MTNLLALLGYTELHVQCTMTHTCSTQAVINKHLHIDMVQTKYIICAWTCNYSNGSYQLCTKELSLQIEHTKLHLTLTT